MGSTTPDGPTRIHRERDGAILCGRVEVARSMAQRMRGLIGRAGLDPDEGLFIATSSIHMMFMRFPIDALFVGAPDATGSRRVVGTREGLPPWRGVVWPVRGATGVVELAAGTLRARGVVVGDMVRFEPAGDTAEGAGVRPGSAG
jgi:uncharacterized protein